MNNLDMHIHFLHIEEYSAELAAYIIDHYDSDRYVQKLHRFILMLYVLRTC